MGQPKHRPFTSEGLKAWAADNRDLGMTVVKAQAFFQVERERVYEYVTPILLSYGFVDEDDGAPITNPDKLYLAGDSPEIEAKCKAYYAECDRAHRAHAPKWDSPEGNWPDLEAEWLMIQAENLLLDSLARFTGVSGFNGGLELRQKALTLALNATVGGVK